MSDISIEDRVSDAINLSQLRSIPRYVGFLTAAQCAECSPILRTQKHSFFGGYEGAERTMLGVFPDWCDFDSTAFPITAITFSYKSCYKLTHRDFLGTVMSLGITRQSVGDILIENGRAVMFITEELAGYVLSQISKVGGVGVSLSEGYTLPLPNSSSVTECSGTVASLRADCVIAALIGKSRGIALELIEKGMVSINSVGTLKPTQVVKANDIVSVRGSGKYKITESGTLSKKGRIILKWNKYI